MIDFNKIKQFLKSIDIKTWTIVGLVIIILFMTKGCGEKETVEVEVPVEIEVPVPVKDFVHDTIEKPVPYAVESPVNSSLKNMYLKAQDSIEQLHIFIDAITERDYNEKFEDTFQTINVYTKTRGEIIKQNVSYKTKPYTIPIDTVIKTVVETPKVNKKFFMLEAGNPINTIEPKAKASVLFINKKDKVISVGYERDFYNNLDYGWIGYGFRF